MRRVGQLSVSEQLNLKNVYTCVLVKGEHEDGRRFYAYFGLFLDNMEKVIEAAENGTPFNPKDLNAIVLARAEGEPSQEVRDFMRRKFSFSEDEVVLEISQE